GLEPARRAGAYGALLRSFRKLKNSLCQLRVTPISVARCAIKDQEAANSFWKLRVVQGGVARRAAESGSTEDWL
ncbi:hypothetical protein A2U01_0102832, partial [Trifolium medium]|nr:hypothetical protein [Trifolium medium]